MSDRVENTEKLAQNPPDLSVGRFRYLIWRNRRANDARREDILRRLNSPIELPSALPRWKLQAAR
jgi:hypothetical protein